MAPVVQLRYAGLTIPSAPSINAASSRNRQIAAAGWRAAVPLTYGTDRVGALLLNVLLAAPNSNTLLVQCLWGFSCFAINTLKLNDQNLPAEATITNYTGSQTTADAALVAAFAAQGITYSDTLNGYAYSVIAMPVRAFDGQLNLSARILGRQVYDPRKDSTAGGSGTHRLNDPATWQSTNVPALQLADFLSNKVYGCGQPVDWSSVPAAATANEALVGSPAEAKRLCGVTFNTPANVVDIAEALRAYAGCWIVPGPNGLRLVPDVDASPVASFSHSAGQIRRLEPLAIQDAANAPTAVEVIYTDTSTFPYREDSAIAKVDGAGTTLPWRLSQVRMPGIQRYSQALREATERLNKLRLADVSTNVELYDEGVKLEAGDIITLTHPAGLSAQKMRVQSAVMFSPGRWRVAAVEHDPTAYSSTVVARIGAPLPSFINPAGPPSTVGTITFSVEPSGTRFRWPANPESDVNGYELRRGGTSWEDAIPMSGTEPTIVGATDYLWAQPASGTYIIRIKAIDAEGLRSAADSTITVTLGAVSAGASAYNARLTRPAAVVPADAAGNVSDFSAAGGQFEVSRGGSILSSGIAYSVVSEVGVDVSINATTGAYTVSALLTDTGTARFRAVVTDGPTLECDYTIAKSKAGAQGPAGGSGPQGDPGPTGPAGTPTPTIRVSQSAVNFPADSAGNVTDYANATIAVQVFQGTTDDTANWSISRTSVNCTTTVDTTLKSVTVTAMVAAVDFGSVTIFMSRAGFASLSVRVPVTKARAGVAGAPGEPGADGAPGAAGAAGESVPWVQVTGDNLNANNAGFSGRGVLTSGGYSHNAGTSGHTMTVFNPVDGSRWAGPISFNTNDLGTDSLVSALATVPAGYIVTLYTFNDSRCDAALRTALVAMGSGSTVLWGPSRVSHVFIGSPGLLPGQAYEQFSSLSTAGGVITQRGYYNLGGLIRNGATGSQGAGAFTWVTSSGAVGAGSILTKTGTTSGWNEHGYSAEAFVGGAYAAARIDGAGIFGLNTDPATDTSWESIDYAWYHDGNGNTYILESGNFAAGPMVGGFGANTRFIVRYDNREIQYVRDGLVVRTISVPANLRFHLDSSLSAPGTRLLDVAFGPVGARGQDGANGVDGADGVDGQRGSVEASRAISGSAWSDSEAVAAIAAYGYGSPVTLDRVTLYNTGTGFTQTRFFDGLTWQTFTALINGNLLVDGTVGAVKITTPNLAAISANLGTVTAGSLSAGVVFAGSLNAATGSFIGAVVVGTNPVVSGTTMTGSGARLNSNGTFAIGNATRNLNFNGTTLTLNGDLVVTGNLQNNAVSKPIGATADDWGAVSVTLVITSQDLPSGSSTVPVIIIASQDVVSNTYFDVGVNPFNYTTAGELLFALPPAGGVFAMSFVVNLPVGSHVIACWNRGAGNAADFNTRKRTITAYLAKR